MIICEHLINRPYVLSPSFIHDSGCVLKLCLIMLIKAEVSSLSKLLKIVVKRPHINPIAIGLSEPIISSIENILLINFSLLLINSSLFFTKNSFIILNVHVDCLIMIYLIIWLFLNTLVGKLVSLGLAWENIVYVYVWVTYYYWIGKFW